MIRVDESDPVGEVPLSFPFRDVQIKRGVDPKTEYDLQSELGRGKFGTVYKCVEKATGLALAAKYVSVPKKEDRRNVEREIEIMRTLQHPRLIQLYDAFEIGKVMWVILELIEGGELFERVIDDDFILTEKACTVFMRQICEGVDFIHKQRILHLDMKPENILCLTKTGNRVKIIDFGLARKFDPEKKLQVLFGTPEFVAPEVVNFDDIGYGTDMWSVGVICYVLLSGLSPFMGATDVETMANVTIAKYDFDDEAFLEISDLAKDFIRKLLLKDLNKRLTAEDCLKHEWLKRKKRPPQRAPSMDVTKDNLKQFVERWNEHPNSPYIFEITSDLFELQRSNSSNSLICESPSPCESIASLPTSDDLNGDSSLAVPSMDSIRRASDSTCIVKSQDTNERISLAEEIKKLSEKLFQLSNNLPTSINCNKSPIFDDFKLETKSENHSLPKDHPDSPQCTIPWRRPKFKLNGMSRDVPLAIPKTDHLNSTSPNGTKDLLLQLLGHWDGPKMRTNTRHASVSSEWTESDSLGQRTISSLNTFFQSRATSKKITPFHLHQN